MKDEKSFKIEFDLKIPCSNMLLYSFISSENVTSSFPSFVILNPCKRKTSDVSVSHKYQSDITKVSHADATGVTQCQ